MAREEAQHSPIYLNPAAAALEGDTPPPPQSHLGNDSLHMALIARGEIKGQDPAAGYMGKLSQSLTSFLSSAVYGNEPRRGEAMAGKFYTM